MKLFNWFKSVQNEDLLLEKDGKIAELEALYNARNLTVKVLQEEIITAKREYFAKEKVYENEYSMLQRKYAALQGQIVKDPNEELWNNRRPKITQLYKRIETDGEYEIDVRNFFQPNDSSLSYYDYGTFDERALKCLSWVINTIVYTDDKKSYGFGEYWAYAYQTLKRKLGDCEDGAVLLANMMIKSGIPYWRVRLCAGSVNGGGHAYCTYCRETDNQWVICDWCYWANTKPMKDRPLHKDEQNYNDKNKNFYIWFSWNSLYCFGNMDTMRGKPKHFK